MNTSVVTQFRLESLLCAMVPVDLVLASLCAVGQQQEEGDQQQQQQSRTAEHHNDPVDSTTCSTSKSLSWASHESQQEFSNLIQKHWCSKYGPSRRYLKSLIRRYISRIEALQVAPDSTTSSLELSDELMEAMAFSIMSPTDSFKDRLKSSVYFAHVDPNEWGYVSFHVPSTTRRVENEEVITGKVTESTTDAISLKIRVFPQNNDVGVMKVWESGACLAEYLMDQPHLVSGKRVVELGAGVGFTGLIASGACGAAHVQMTDYTNTTLENLRHNIKINHQWLQEQRRLTCSKDTSSLQVDPTPETLVASSYLEWDSYANDLHVHAVTSGGQFTDSYSESLSALSSADILLAADVCYIVEVIPSLVKTVKRFLHLQSSSGRCETPKCALFATMLRNKATFDTFVENLLDNGISCNFLDQKEVEQLPRVFPVYYVQPRSDVRICKLTVEQNLRT